MAPYECTGFGAKVPGSKLELIKYNMRDLNNDDVKIKVKYCGICHSDIHQVDEDWSKSMFPMIPGHEIIGLVESVGSGVTKFKVGDAVGIGCFVESCGDCCYCSSDYQQFCSKLAFTYNSKYSDGSNTYGGYGSHLTVKENYVFRIPENLNRPEAAPLLCAGVTVYSPMMRFNMNKKGSKIAVVGLGGLGHMAVKFGVAFGCEVTVISTTASKKESALQLGATHFITSSDVISNMDLYKCQYDGVIDTVCASKSLDVLLTLVKPLKSYVLLGLPKAGNVNSFSAGSLITKNACIAGSLISGFKETSEMLEFCSKNNILSDIEVIPISKVNEAYERVKKSDVKYRFVLDVTSGLM